MFSKLFGSNKKPVSAKSTGTPSAIIAGEKFHPISEKIVGIYSYTYLPVWEPTVESTLGISATIFNKLKLLSKQQTLLCCEYSRRDEEFDPLYDYNYILTVTIPYTHAREFVLINRNEFRRLGCTLHQIERNYGYSTKFDIVGIIPSTNWLDLIRFHATNGANHCIENEDVVEKLTEWNTRYQFQVIGCQNDYFEASIQIPEAECLAFAQEVYEFCPDVVDQGTDTVEALAQDLFKTQTLYLWWD